ncbi:hypothetical protein CspeluHIS016_0306580 [Cutaneotrichosporon spelunceum]|uniref:DUF4211 domain-containing protein n=1 Tax=Cutaneotrichosporon spelunceum TaxID=1672016 RepID=A0AAD3TTZ7_9TREE|nr:hypothetical protein CspeluHIS016_0306580 [Cutaneotrichosporon spelunceum]
MGPLSQADIDSFFSTSSPRSRTPSRPRPRGRASRSSPPPAPIVVHDSDDDIVALPSRPGALPRPLRPSFSKKFSRLDSDESAEDSNSNIRAVRLSPQRTPWRGTTQRIVNDDEEEDTLSVSGESQATKAASISEGEPDTGRRSGMRTRTRARLLDPDCGDSRAEVPSPPRRRTRSKRQERSQESDTAGERPPRRRRRSNAKRSSAKRVRLDPDEDEESIEAVTEDEGVDEIELDEPERFVTATRLRTRGETVQQRMLRKLKNRRLNLPSSEEDEDEEDSEDVTGAWKYVRDDDDGFISEDDGFDERLMPSEFSLGYAQSQEYKFKVMFQYLLLLVIHGPGVLPLRGPQKEYMTPVGELRSYVRGIRNLRVRSQIWRPDLVEALQTYPTFLVSNRAEIARYCNACNRRNQHCWHSVYLTGTQYNPESHEDVKGSVSNDDDDDDEDEGEVPLPRNFNMGPHCLNSSRLYHALSHWEHGLFRRIRGLYRELLRAKGVDIDESGESDVDGNVDEFMASSTERVAELRRTQLPDEGDINAVLEWMDAREYQAKAFEHFTSLEQQARTLGGDDELRETERDHRPTRRGH